MQLSDVLYTETERVITSDGTRYVVMDVYPDVEGTIWYVCVLANDLQGAEYYFNNLDIQRDLTNLYRKNNIEGLGCAFITFLLVGLGMCALIGLTGAL